MFGRYQSEENDNKTLTLPANWRNDIEKLLNQLYKKEIEKMDKKFEVHGFLYPQEAVITATLVDNASDHTIPTSFHISIDIDGDQKKSDEKFKLLVDALGPFCDYYFSQPHEEVEKVYQSRWQEETFKGKTLFYKISRENISLTLLANQLLESKNS